jgi:hypothetical protein
MDDQERYLPDRLVAARYGKNVRSIKRWAADPALNFPPAIDINGRPHRALSKLEAWERARAAIATPRKRMPANCVV